MNFIKLVVFWMSILLSTNIFCQSDSLKSNGWKDSLGRKQGFWGRIDSVQHLVFYDGYIDGIVEGKSYAKSFDKKHFYIFEYRNGKLNGTTLHYYNNTLIQILIYYYGELESRFEFTKRGLFAEYHYENGELDGEIIIYRRGNRIKYVRKYENGILVKESKY